MARHLDFGYLFDVIKKGASKVGLEVNAAKCHLWLPKPLQGPVPKEFEGVQIHTAEDGIRVLGSPIGGKEWTAKLVADFIKGFKGALQRLGSPRATSHILRSCLGSARVMFFFFLALFVTPLIHVTQPHQGTHHQRLPQHELVFHFITRFCNKELGENDDRICRLNIEARLRGTGFAFASTDKCPAAAAIGTL